MTGLRFGLEAGWRGQQVNWIASPGKGSSELKAAKPTGRRTLANWLVYHADGFLDTGRPRLAWITAQPAILLMPGDFGVQSTLAHALHDMNLHRRALRRCDIAASLLSCPTPHSELAAISDLAVQSCLALRHENPAEARAWTAAIRTWLQRGIHDDPDSMMAVIECDPELSDLQEPLRILAEQVEEGRRQRVTEATAP